MNALTVQYALDYEKEGFSFIALCPGVSSISHDPLCDSGNRILKILF